MTKSSITNYLIDSSKETVDIVIKRLCNKETKVIPLFVNVMQGLKKHFLL